MRVMVTGGTGFLGSHSVKALVDAGHDVRLLVRSPARIAPALAPHGLGEVDHVVGDITDVGSVERALEGCDAVLHTANIYTLDPRRAEEILDVNPRGTANVLRAAHERGMDPIVHVSSNAALMPSPDRPLTNESPLGDPPGAYSQSKVEAERIARGLQDEGAPVVILNPTGLLGPHDPHLGDFTAVARDVLRGRLPFVVAGTTPMVDVRDVATVSAAVFEPGRGARRYMVSGGYVTMRDFAIEASRLTGRRIPAVALPGRPMLAVGRAADWVQRRLGVRLPVNYEGPWFLVYGAKIDVSATERDFGVRFRTPAQTLADTYRWLFEAGLVSRKQAGTLAADQSSR
jgi:nucleoside-diphosphate-sugar epimerase